MRGHRAKGSGLWGLAALAGLAGCVCGTDLTHQPFACSTDAECADGYQCLGGSCAVPGSLVDGGADAGLDAGGQDAGLADAGFSDAGLDGGTDAGSPPDAGLPRDSGTPDAGPADSGAQDAGPCAAPLPLPVCPAATFTWTLVDAGGTPTPSAWRAIAGAGQTLYAAAAYSARLYDLSTQTWGATLYSIPVGGAPFQMLVADPAAGVVYLADGGSLVGCTTLNCTTVQPIPLSIESAPFHVCEDNRGQTLGVGADLTLDSGFTYATGIAGWTAIPRMTPPLESCAADGTSTSVGTTTAFVATVSGSAQLARFSAGPAGPLSTETVCFSPGQAANITAFNAIWMNPTNGDGLVVGRTTNNQLGTLRARINGVWQIPAAAPVPAAGRLEVVNGRAWADGGSEAVLGGSAGVAYAALTDPNGRWCFYSAPVDSTRQFVAIQPLPDGGYWGLANTTAGTGVIFAGTWQ